MGIIKIQGLSKKFQLDSYKQEGYRTFRDLLYDTAKKGINSLSGKNPEISSKSDFWALRNVDLEIEQGDSVAIVGKNGAGKSTLLKLLSRITEPTSGRIEINGRLASLLEVGTGFHPELSGRENIFLNGAILGMTRNEIKSKFDEIVEFSGVGNFLDTPVKRYSSGMYVRLAFAVAAHLESDILIIDEVLAVGDSEFQKKCLGKMDEVSKKFGKTILFVSHNMLAARQLCNKGVYLNRGSVEFTGLVDEVIERYEIKQSNSSFNSFRIEELDLLIKSIVVNPDINGKVIPKGKLVIQIELEAAYAIKDIGIELVITNSNTHGLLFASNTKTRKNLDVKLNPGQNIISCTIEKFDLASGIYNIGFGIDKPFYKFYFYELNLMQFHVEEEIIIPSLVPTTSPYGHVLFDHVWECKN
jgi:lipopolysaccharide transport system ATP-binding protein